MRESDLPILKWNASQTYLFCESNLPICLWKTSGFGNEKELVRVKPTCFGESNLPILTEKCESNLPFYTNCYAEKCESNLPIFEQLKKW